MKISIPTNDGKVVADHFGRCSFYACFDEDGNEMAKIENTSEHMGGKGLPPELLSRNSVDVLLCRDLGPYAIKLCSEKKIAVYKVPNAKLIQELFKSWQKGFLSEASLSDGCDSHQEE